jgi:hypothetical protein
VVVPSPSRRAGAEPGKPTASAEGLGERTADTRRASLVDDIPSITLIISQSIILITLNRLRISLGILRWIESANARERHEVLLEPSMERLEQLFQGG